MTKVIMYVFWCNDDSEMIIQNVRSTSKWMQQTFTLFWKCMQYLIYESTVSHLRNCNTVVSPLSGTNVITDKVTSPDPLTTYAIPWQAETRLIPAINLFIFLWSILLTWFWHCIVYIFGLAIIVIVISLLHSNFPQDK